MTMQQRETVTTVRNYLWLEPLGELHGDVHVGQTEARVVQAVIVHCPTDFISEKNT